MNIRRFPLKRLASVALAVLAGMTMTACGDGAKDTAAPAGTPVVSGPGGTNQPGPGAGSATPGATPTGTGAAPDWGGGVSPAPKGGTLGPTGTCRIPGSFDLPAKWQVKDLGGLGVVDDGLAMRCEADGEPAGIRGALQVWAAVDGSTPRAVLEKFVGKSSLQPTDVAYRETPIGSRPGVEVSYRFDQRSTLAFAVPAGGEVLLVIWGGMAESFEAGLPAYLLARSTYRPAG